MNQDKKQLLEEQIGKIEIILETLESNFAEELADEINFLSVVKSNIAELVKE